MAVKVALDRISARSYTVPTEERESDGTLSWDSTTMVLVGTEAGGRSGIGYSYTHASVAHFINQKLAPLLLAGDIMNLPDLWRRMVAACRNYGDDGLTMMAVAAVDSSLWDLKARVLDVPLVTLLGAAREAIPVYGSGGFTSYSVKELEAQLREWQALGMTRMKIKIGRHPGDDPGRIGAARRAIGDEAELFVDANGAYTLKEAAIMAECLAENGVTWFEEPLSHRDLLGTNALRRNSPPAIEITGGEYGFNLDYFQRMLQAEAVDVLQADATRCSMSVFLAVAALCQAHLLPLSSHTAPALHCHVCCALLPVRHMEYFYDHVRIERMFFDGLPELRDGMLLPDLSRPGTGLVRKKKDMQSYAD